MSAANTPVAQVNTIESVLSSIQAGPAPESGHFLARYMHTKLNYDRTLSIYIGMTNHNPIRCTSVHYYIIRNDKLANIIDLYISKDDYPEELLTLFEKNLDEIISVVLLYKKETELYKKAQEDKVLTKQEEVERIVKLMC